MQDAKCKMQNVKCKIQDDDMISFDKSNSNDFVIKQISYYANVTITRIIMQSKSRIAINFEDIGRRIV
jgi:UDP-N-acetylmuramyl pentapeptide synthase